MQAAEQWLLANPEALAAADGNQSATAAVPPRPLDVAGYGGPAALPLGGIVEVLGGFLARCGSVRMRAAASAPRVGGSDGAPPTSAVMCASVRKEPSTASWSAFILNDAFSVFRLTERPGAEKKLYSWPSRLRRRVCWDDAWPDGERQAEGAMGRRLRGGRKRASAKGVCVPGPQS